MSAGLFARPGELLIEFKLVKCLFHVPTAFIAYECWMQLLSVESISVISAYLLEGTVSERHRVE